MKNYLYLFLLPVTSLLPCEYTNTRLATLMQRDNLGYQLTSMPATNIKFTASGSMRNDAIFNSRQMIEVGGTNISSIWPIQPETTAPLNVLHEDIFARPTASIVNILPTINASVGNICLDKADLSLFMSVSFIGFNFGNGVALLNNLFAQLVWENDSFAFGRMNHPLMIPYCFPDMVANGFGTPITPYSLAPQLRYQHNFDRVHIMLNLFNEYLTADNGPLAFPYNFLNLYLRNSLMPGMNIGLEYDDNDYCIGVKLHYKRLRPRLFTQPNPLIPGQQEAIARGEHIGSLTYCLYGTLNFQDLFFAAQFINGDNGTSWSNLGGYAVSSINPSNDVRTYTNIRYLSIWGDISLLNTYKNLRPGIYAGFTKNRGSKKPIVFDSSTGLPIVYTIDDYARFTQEIFAFTPKQLMSLLRIAPRLWIYFSRNFLLGLEWSFFRTEYSIVNEFYQPIAPQIVKSWQGVASLQYLY